MAITIDWSSKIINIPKEDMTLIQSSPIEIRELDLDSFRLALKSLEDDEEGIPFPKTHNHETEKTLGGILYARKIEIINGYTVTFEDGQYVVNAVGANSNLSDVRNPNQVSLNTSNSAGLVSAGSGLTTAQADQLNILYEKSSGDWVLENNQLIIYKSLDSQQVVMKFDLFDENDTPSMTDVRKRVRTQ